jgi:hypothetical protein
MKVKADDKIDSKDILKINLTANKQTASPAYLGRLPHNHDREKQLQFVDKTIRQQVRISSECQEQPSKFLPHKREEEVRLASTPSYQPLSTLVVMEDQEPISKRERTPMPSPIRVKKAYRKFNIITGSPVLIDGYDLPSLPLGS